MEKPMKKQTKLALVAALCSLSVSGAHASEFIVTWTNFDKTDPSGSLTGIFNIDLSVLPQRSDEAHSLPDPAFNIVRLSFAHAGDYNYYTFDASGLDYSKQLIGQVMSDGCIFGDLSFVPFCSAGDNGDFNLFASDDAPTGSYFMELMTQPVPEHDAPPIQFYYVSSILPVAVPEPASWAMILFGMGVVGLGMRRRQNVRITHC